MPDDHPGVARWMRIALLCAVLAPAVVGLVAAARTPWHPHTDRAVIAARTADVWGGDLPLTGAYSRYAFNHPGPMANLVLSVPYELSGEQPRSLLAGTLIIAGASAALAVWLALGVAGLSGGLAAATMALVAMRAIGPEVLRDPWNPFVLLGPVLVCLVAAWATSSGSRWSLTVLVVAGSFVVQAHVGTAVLVAALVVWATAAYVVAERRTRAWVVPVVVATGAGLVCWLLPFVDQLTAEAPNLSAIAAFFTGGAEAAAGERLPLGQALGIAGRELLPIGPWLTGDEPEFIGVQPAWSGWSAVLAVLLAAMVVVRRRLAPEDVRASDPVARLAVTALVAIGATVVALAGVRDLPAGYLFRWTWVVGAFAWIALVWAIGSTVWARVRRPLPTWVPAVAVGAVAVLGLVVAVPAWDADPPDRAASDAVAALIGPAEAALEPGQPITFATVGDDIGQLGGGIAYELERRGHPLAVVDDPANRRIWGNRRAERDPQADGTARLVIATGAGAAEMELPEVDLLGTFDNLTADERAEADALRSRIAELVAASGQVDGAFPDLRAAGVSEADIARLQDLAERDYQAAVYLDRSGG
ncbi:MAG: hypothetical protein KDB36_03445 [Acidimicrobiales bacterium]|nr:hypothetical protein [Acidimicrobiales bacterium]